MRSTLTLAALTLFTLGAGASSAAAQYDSDVQLVRNWYSQFLSRAPAPEEINSLVNELRRGVLPEEVLGTVLASREYIDRHGGTPEGFILGLYRDILHRRPNGPDLQ